MGAAAASDLPATAALARARDPDRFLCALFAPADRREALFALIAYNGELARAREAGARNPLAALMRLQWWRDTVASAAAGHPAPRHEVAAPLHAAIASGRIDPADLIAMADAREAETEEGGIPTREAFEAYLRGTAGGFAVASGRLLGAAGGPAMAALQEAGALFGLAGVLRSVPALARQGRCLLPRDALAAEGLTPEAVLAAPEAQAVRAVIAALAASALPRVEEVRRALRGGAATGLPRTAIAASLPLVLAARDLRRLARRPAAAVSTAPGRGLGDRLAVTAAGLTGRP
jgi:15-cis-phytoene synthase